MYCQTIVLCFHTRIVHTNIKKKQAKVIVISSSSCKQPVVPIFTSQSGCSFLFFKISFPFCSHRKVVQLTFRVVLVKHRLAAYRCPLLVLVYTVQELAVLGRGGGRVRGRSAVRKVRRGVAKPPHGGGVQVPAQAEAVRKRGRKVRRLLQLIAGQEGAGAAVLQPRGVLRRPPAGLRGERQTTLSVHLTGPAGSRDNSDWALIERAPE